MAMFLSLSQSTPLLCWGWEEIKSLLELPRTFPLPPQLVPVWFIIFLFSFSGSWPSLPRIIYLTVGSCPVSIFQTLSWISGSQCCYGFICITLALWLVQWRLRRQGKKRLCSRLPPEQDSLTLLKNCRHTSPVLIFKFLNT